MLQESGLGMRESSQFGSQKRTQELRKFDFELLKHSFSVPEGPPGHSPGTSRRLPRRTVRKAGEPSNKLELGNRLPATILVIYIITVVIITVFPGARAGAGLETLGCPPHPLALVLGEKQRT